jgi:hypothetical protein
MTNLNLYVTEGDYLAFSGPDWPGYKDYLAGVQVKDPALKKEIDNFTAQQQAQGIKFPINTATACQSKWTWSSLWLNELATSSCHRVKHVPVDLDDFDNFHNVPKKLQDRQLMLEGKWPQGGCESCRYVEEAGGFSDRHHNLGIRGLTPPELETNPLAIHVSPRIVEIFAHNTCNLSCLYCNGNLSSRIENENNKFGEFNQNGVHIPIITAPTSAREEYFEKFKNWLERNITGLVRLHLLGGETFIQHELLTAVLNIIERNPSPNLELCIFSNLNVPDKYWNLYINRIKDLQATGNIRVFDLTCSIDCWGPEQELVRWGLNLEKFEQRFAWASEQSESWLRVNVNQTITNMTVRTMPELIDKIAHYSQYRHIGHYFQFITGQHYLHPEVFSYEHWTKDFDRIFSAMPQRTVDQQEAIPRMQGMQKQLQQSTRNNYKKIDQLRTYLDELDRRRGTNWRELFSYLDINE